MNSRKNIHILLVEDDDIDAEAVMRGFQSRHIAGPLTRVRDGVEALAVLQRKEGYPTVTWPFLILLDLNMPRMNGIEFLQTIRKDPELRRSVVFVNTTSDRDEDMLAAFDEQVAGYLLKSRAGPDFSELASMLDTYGRIAEFPGEVE